MNLLIHNGGEEEEENELFHNNNNNNKDWMDFFLPFLAGAATASVIFFIIQMRKQLSSLAAALDDENISWIEPWYQTVEELKARIEFFDQDLRSRIGELPTNPLNTARKHWPWETIRQSIVRSVSRLESQSGLKGDREDHDDEDETDVVDETEAEEDNGDEQGEGSTTEKKGFCIGSIFGLDVGGTLGKLVYFEQRAPDYDPVSSARERHYSAAASAREVLMARRSREKESSDTAGNGGIIDNVNGIGVVAGTQRSRIRRRRSLNLGQMGRNKQLEQEQLEEEMKQKNQQQQTQQKMPHRHSSHHQLSSSHHHQKDPQQEHENEQPHRHVHSQASNQDLKRMYAIRQESVPDSLHHYIAAAKKNATIPGGSVVFPENMVVNVAPVEEDGDGESSKNTHNGSTSNNTKSSMKKARSMFDFSKLRDRAEALDRFYNFARRLDSYDKGVKDNELSFYSRELGGDFHFIRFETRYMQNAMDLIRVNNLHLNICEMGATGGGAHKFASAWQRQLGIRMDKQEELESLVAGMQFVLSTVVGECYTYKPPKKKRNSQKQQASSSRRNENSSTNPTATKDGTTGMTNEENIQKQPPKLPSSPSESSSEFHVGAPLMDTSESSEDDNASSASSTSSSSSSTPPSPSASPSASPQLKPDTSDQWWLSKKVQRDSVSYSSTYPYLLISIGTGVSILRVDGPRKHERVSGSTIGGGTYWGLMRLLTDAEDFDEVLDLAEQGDPSKVDMMVGDIYGKNSGALEKIGLPSNVVASSFGKLVAKEDPARGVRQEDLARALLLMVTNNIGQVGYLNAKLHKTSRIYFVGNFLRGNNISQKRLSYAISYWSKGEMEALFLEHEGYFGALGSFLLSQNISHGDQGFFQWDSRPPQPSSSESVSAGLGGEGGTSGKNAGAESSNSPSAASLHRRSTTYGG